MVKAEPGSNSLATRVRVTNPDRVIDSSTGITKIKLVRYYDLIGDRMMEHLKDRPVALLRAPSGIGGQLFFQKHTETEKLPGIRQLDPLVRASGPHGVRSGPGATVSRGPRCCRRRNWCTAFSVNWGSTRFVCVWSARARPGLGISVPVQWDELDSLKSSSHWTIRAVQARLAKGNTPWSDYQKSARTLTAAMQKLGYESAGPTPGASGS